MAETLFNETLHVSRWSGDKKKGHTKKKKKRSSSFPCMMVDNGK